MDALGEKLKRIRKAKGISQTVVAESCGIKQSSYANIESGKTQNITIDIGKGIAKAVGVSFYELFEMEPDYSESVQKLITENENLDKQNKVLLEKITEKEKIISLQEQVIQNLKEAIFESSLQTSKIKSSELFQMMDETDFRRFNDNFYSFLTKFLDKLKDERCFSDAEITAKKENILNK